jgi:hypothetical protein
MKFKFEVGDLVRYHGRKHKIIDRWYDEMSTNRYEIRAVIGKNLAGDSWSVPENAIKPYTKG